MAFHVNKTLKIKVGCSVDVGNPVVVERAAAGCNFDMPYLSEMETREASEDTAEQQQKKICAHEEICHIPKEFQRWYWSLLEMPRRKCFFFFFTVHIKKEVWT